MTGRQDSHRSRTLWAARLASIAMLVVLLPVPARASHEGLVDKSGRGIVELISVDSNEAQHDGHSGAVECGFDRMWDGASMSDDGRYLAFTSTANLSDQNTVPLFTDVYVRDRKTGTTTLASVNSIGLPTGLPPDAPIEVPDGLCQPWSFNPAISGNGRYLAFTSHANLTGEALGAAINPASNLPFLKVYVRDLKKGRTHLISKNWQGSAPLAESGMKGVSISRNGSVVVFLSEATDLVEGQDPECPTPAGASSRPCRQAYAFHRHTGKISLVSVSHDGAPTANNEIFGAEVSANGRYVMFDSPASNLVENDDNLCPRLVLTWGINCPDVFLRDLHKERTEIVSLGVDGTQGDEASYRAPGRDENTTRNYISSDGRFVLFNSSASNLVPSGMGGNFVRDRKTGRTERVSVNSDGAQVGGTWESITEDGRYVMQLVDSCNLLDCVTGLHGLTGTSVYDRRTGQLDLVKLHRKDGTTNNLVEDLHPTTFISADGQEMIWTTSASSYVEKDENGSDLDVLARRLSEPRLGALPADMSGYPRVTLLGDASFSRVGIWERKPQNNSSSLAMLRGVHSARVVYRPELGDLYVRLDLDPIEGVAPATAAARVYGVDMTIDGVRYEVRATSSTLASVKLFRCVVLCDQVATLQGGYGTVGEAIVATIPLHAVGLKDGGVIEQISPVSTTEDLTMFTPLKDFTVGGRPRA